MVAGPAALPPLARNQFAVQEVARSLLTHRTDERLPSTLELQERLGVGSGTVQKAFRMLEETGVAITHSRGHLGRYVVSLDPGRVWSLAGLPALHAVLTPPGALEIYSLVDGLLDEFGRLGLPLQVNYQRGNMNRLTRIMASETSFALMSSGAAATLGRDDVVAVPLGPGTYYSAGSIVLLSKAGADAHRSRLRVGIDRDSSDHVRLTNAEFGQMDGLQYVDCQFPKVPAEILADRIDVGIWHRMTLLVPLHLMGLTAESIAPKTEELLRSMSAATIVFPKARSELATALGYLDLARVTAVQKARLGTLTIDELYDSSWGY